MHPQDREPPNYQTTAIARPESSMRALAVPRDANDMYGLAERMFKAGLVPQSFKSIEGAFLAMMKGAEYGLLPQQSLSGFYVIGNVAHPYGTCLRGIVKAAHHFEDEIEGCVEGVEEMRYMASEENQYPAGSVRYSMFAELQRALNRRLKRVTERVKTLPMYFCGWSVMKRRGAEPTCVLFDTFDAQRGLLAGKDMWTKYPTRMYMHRASTFNRRDQFADALMGLEMTAEEYLELPVEQRASAIDAQAAEVNPPKVSPGESLDKLARPKTPAPAPTPVVHEEAPPPATGAARAAIYAGQGNAPPSSDMPHDSDDAKAQAQPIGTEVKPNPKQKSPGAMALSNALDACRAAGLDPTEIGRKIMTKKFGEGVKTSEISDNEKSEVAREIQIAATQSGAPDTDEPAEDPADF